MPDFSVVIPLFDMRAQIVATLASVRAQRMAPIEIIVVDDGSTDDGPARVMMIDDPRIRLIHQANAGAGAARNTGFAAARGDWVAILDADDLWLPTHLQSLAAVIAAFPHADLVAADACVLASADAGAALAAAAENAGAAAAAALREIDLFRDFRPLLLTASSVAIRRSAFAAFGGFAHHAAGEDADMWIRFALDHVLAVTDAQTVFYVRGAGGVMDAEQARLRSRKPVPVSPVFATLDAALADPRHVARRADIRTLANRWRLQFGRELVYHGRGREARAMLAGLGPEARPYRLLSHVPGPALRQAAAVYSFVKRQARRTP